MSIKPQWITLPGNLGDISEGVGVNIQLLYYTPISSVVTSTILDGELPSGLTLSASGQIIGTPGTIQETAIYYFTVRLTNSAGDSDRGFYFTEVNATPTWTEGTNLGSVYEYSYFNHSFSLNDAPVPTLFSMVAGTLPSGLSITPTGQISGLLNPIPTTPIVYTLTMRATFPNEEYLERTFTLTVNQVVGNVPPVWVTPIGTLGNIQLNQASPFYVLAIDPNGTALTYSVTAGTMPSGLTFQTTGIITGICTDTTASTYLFTARATDGVNPITRDFNITTNQTSNIPTEWITPAGSLGSILEGENSLLEIQASDPNFLQYTIISGALPTGLQLDVTSGGIFGTVQQQTPGVYSFTAKATSLLGSITRNFSITIVDNYSTDAMKASAILYDSARFDWYDYVDEQVAQRFTSIIYRPYDPNFGINYGAYSGPKIDLIGNVIYATKADTYDAVSSVKKERIIVGPYALNAVARNADGEIVYEVVYYEIADSMTGLLTTELNIETGLQAHPEPELVAWRTGLMTLGQDGEEPLPLWMTCEQTEGDEDSVIGWKPVIVLCYTIPGNSESVINFVNNTPLPASVKEVEIDRILVEPAASSAFTAYPLVSIVPNNRF